MFNLYSCKSQQRPEMQEVEVPPDAVDTTVFSIPIFLSKLCSLTLHIIAYVVKYTMKHTGCVIWAS